jgi:hypothetical protein
MAVDTQSFMNSFHWILSNSNTKTNSYSVLENLHDFCISEHDRICWVSEVPVSNMQIVCTFRKRLMRLQVKMAKIKSDSSLLHESITFFYDGFPLANFFVRNNIYMVKI